MALSNEEINQIAEQLVHSKDNINDVMLQITREGDVLTQERMLLQNDLVSSGFIFQELKNLPEKVIKTETYHQYEYSCQKSTVYPVQATFKFSEEALTKTPGLAKAIESKSNISTTIQTADNQIDDVVVQGIAKLISLNKDSVIKLSATYHYELHSSKKDTQKFIQNLQELGLTIIGKPEISYDTGLNSKASDFSKPMRVEIKIKYDDSKPDSEISNSLKNRASGRSAGMI